MHLLKNIVLNRFLLRFLGDDFLFLEIFASLSDFVLLFILHVTGSNAFPRPLSPKEEKEYLLLAKEGDKNAKNKLVEHNLRLVAHIIKKYYSNINDQEDLVSIGTIGLIKAINTFNMDKKIKLSSYASRCIENEILMFFRSAKKTSLDVSLSDAIDSDKQGNPLTYMDVMSVEDDIVEKLDIKFKSEKLGGIIKKVLTKREQLVISLRYGLDGNIPITQREVSQKLKISRSYVSRIEKKALEKMKAEFDKNG